MSLEVINAKNHNFWNIDGYKKVIKRIEDGFLFCGDIFRLVQERAEIELKYATKLQTWSKKWSDFINKSNEYGSSKLVLVNSLSEAEAIAKVHAENKDKLQEVQGDIKQWKHSTYKKQVVGGCKEARGFEEEFRKVQKPWTKFLGKKFKYKKDLEALERYLSTMTTVSSGQDKKIQEKIEKCQQDIRNAEGKLEKIKKEIEVYKKVYIEEMKRVFQKAQEFEGKRLLFLKDILIKLHLSLDVSQNDQIPIIYIQWRKLIETINIETDLNYWSTKFGSDMYWPSDIQMEENSSKIEEKPNNQKESLKCHIPSPKSSLKGSKDSVAPSVTKNPPDYDKSLNPFDSEEEEKNISVDSESDEKSFKKEYDPELNPFETSSALYPVLVGEGPKVVAIYDYKSQESDELSLKKGDILITLREKDEQGWCLGDKSGKIGLYPAKFVKPL